MIASDDDSSSLAVVVEASFRDKFQRHLQRAVLAACIACLSFFYARSAPIAPISEVSVYVPGAGFSGFWYHLGLFQSIPSLHEYDYFCYSSGCLGIVLALLEAPVGETYDTCREIQLEFSQRNISSYTMVDAFLNRLLPVEEEPFTEFLPRLNIISTNMRSGAVVQQPSNRSELISLLLRTTRIPFLTGRGWLQDGSERYIDGGFSRYSHPPCRYTVHMPTTWNTYVHSLNPWVSKKKVFEFVELGLGSNLN